MKTKKCYIERNKCRKMCPAILFSGLELLSYLGDKYSTVITEIWPQRVLGTCQSQDPPGDGSEHHCRLVCLWVLSQGGWWPGHHLQLWKALLGGEFENQRHPAPLMFSSELDTRVSWSFPKQPLLQLQALARRWVKLFRSCGSPRLQKESKA